MRLQGKSRSYRRVEQIREQVSITQFLSDLGYHVNPHGGDREQQFACDLHGDGSDGKPSARAYPDTNTWYCFGCLKLRDHISTLKDRKGFTFSEACKSIEKAYALPFIPFDPVEEEMVDFIFQKEAPTFEIMKTRITTILSTQYDEREVTLKQYLSLWEVYDMIVYKVMKKKMSEKEGMEALFRIREKTFEYIKRNIQKEQLCQ